MSSSNKELDSTLDPALVEQLVMAAVAAAAAAAAQASLPPTPASTVATTPTPELLNFTDTPAQTQPTSSNTNQKQLNASKDPISEKVRHDNRERKKRWRLHNEERNKDNDLRCRVNKRAVKLFGKEDSPHKQKWIEEEFQKRRSKRKEKEERRKSHTSTAAAAAAATVVQSEGLPNVLAEPYISLLAANALATTTTTAEENKPEQFAAQLLEFLQQQQQQQQQNQEFANENTVSEKVNEKAVNDNTEETQMDIEEAEMTEEKDKVAYPADAVMTLMQLNAGWRQ